MLTITNEDCMELMKRTPDKSYSLALVDPPYGIGDKFKGGKTGKMNFNEVVEKDWGSNAKNKTTHRPTQNILVWLKSIFPVK